MMARSSGFGVLIKSVIVFLLEMGSRSRRKGLITLSAKTLLRSILTRYNNEFLVTLLLYKIICILKAILLQNLLEIEWNTYRFPYRGYIVSLYIFARQLFTTFKVRRHENISKSRNTYMLLCRFFCKCLT